MMDMFKTYFDPMLSGSIGCTGSTGCTGTQGTLGLSGIYGCT